MAWDLKATAVFNQTVISFYDLFIFNQNFKQEIITALKRREMSAQKKGKNLHYPLGASLHPGGLWQRLGLGFSFLCLASFSVLQRLQNSQTKSHDDDPHWDKLRPSPSAGESGRYD